MLNHIKVIFKKLVTIFLNLLMLFIALNIYSLSRNEYRMGSDKHLKDSQLIFDDNTDFKTGLVIIFSIFYSIINIMLLKSRNKSTSQKVFSSLLLLYGCYSLYMFFRYI